MTSVHRDNSSLKNMSLEETTRLIEKTEALLGQLNNLKNQKLNQKYSLDVFSKEYLGFLENNSSVGYVKSVKASFNHALRYFGVNKIIIDITRSDAEKFIVSLKSHAPRGYRAYFRNMKAAFNIALHWNYIKENPFAKVKLPKKQKGLPEYIYPDQLDSIIGKTRNKTLSEIFRFAFYSGCRRGEIINVKWKNVDFQKRTITIGDANFQTKTRAQRIIPMCKNLYSILWKRYNFGEKSCLKPDGLVFAKPNGFPFHEDTLSKAFKKACRAAKIDEKIHFHSLRHSFASYLVQNGANIYSVQKLLGHSSITTTEIYAHLDIDTLHKSVKVFDAIEKPKQRQNMSLQY